jgi:hypothetical protein
MPGMAAYIISLKAEAEDSEFEVSQGYIARLGVTKPKRERKKESIGIFSSLPPFLPSFFLTPICVCATVKIM